MLIKTLNEVCDIFTGGTPSRSKPEYWTDGSISWIKIGNIKNKYVTEADEFITQEGLNASSAKMLKKGTILYTIFATLGEVGILTIDGCTNQAIAGLTIKNQSEIKPDYLYYFLKSKKKDINKIGRGVAQNNINLSILKKIEIGIPLMSEQEKIIFILDKVENLIRDKQVQIQQMDDLIKARFVEMFGDIRLNPYGWNKELLGSVCDVRDGTHDSPTYYLTGFPLVTSKNVTTGRIDLSGCSFICEEDYIKINERSKVDIGDIIMPMIGTVGKPVIVDIEPRFAIKNVALIKFKIDSKVLNIYIRTLLQSDYFEEVVFNKARGGTQKFVSLGDIRKFEVIIPPLSLQQEFADFVKQVDKSKFDEQKWSNVNDLMYSMIRRS